MAQSRGAETTRAKAMWLWRVLRPGCQCAVRPICPITSSDDQRLLLPMLPVFPVLPRFPLLPVLPLLPLLPLPDERLRSGDEPLC